MDTKTLLLIAFLALASSTKAIAAETPSEPWLVLRSGTSDQPHVLSVRSVLPGDDVRSQFPVQTTFRLAYEPNETGLPAYESDLKALYEIEEWLRAKDPDERVFLQAIRRTGSGVRTWILFVRSESEFLQLLGENSQIKPEFIQDPSWSELATVLAHTRR